MNKRILQLNLKRLTAMLLSLSIIIHSGMKFGVEVYAEEPETIALQVINHGIYQYGEDEPVLLPEESENLWIHENMGEVNWKVSIEGKLSDVKLVELYRGDEILEVLAVKQEYEIPLEDFEYTGSYRLVVTDLEGNVKEAIQQVNIDKSAPVLKKFAVESNDRASWDSETGVAYVENVEGDDVKITVVIDDHADYFQKDAVMLEYSVDGITWDGLKIKSDWEISGREHTMECGFDGKNNEEMIYQFRVSYADRANNQMVLAKESTPKVEETEGGTYTFEQKTVIDHKAPLLTKIQFDVPVQMFDDETPEFSGIATGRITNEKTKLYYDKNAAIYFSVEDTYFTPSDIEVQLYGREHKAAEWEKWKDEISVIQKKTEKGCDFQFTLPERDGEYYATISCTDYAGNQMTYSLDVIDSNLGEAYAGGITDGLYQTPIFVKDSVAPVYTISYEKEPQEYNSVEKIKAVLTLSEINLDLDKLEVSVTAKDINGNQVPVEKQNNYTYDSKTQKLTMEFFAEAYYHVRVKIVDKVQKTVEYQTSYCIDRSAPAVTVVTKDGQRFTNAVHISSGILNDQESDVSYSVINSGWFARIINKMTFGYFAQEKIMVRVKVHDLFSGVKSFHPTCISGGRVIENYRLSEKKFVDDDKSIALYEIELPGDFKGTVRMHGVDYAGNTGNDAGGIGMITESEEQHKKHAKTEIEVLTPFNKTPNYYAGNVKIKYFAEDGVSGFYQVKYLAGKLQETVLYPEGEEISQKVTKTYTIAENKNHVELGLEFLDNAGHLERLAKEKIPVIHIDKTKPKIEIVYDNQNVENEKYYREERTATITITERNFDPNDTKVDISGPDVKLSSWKHEGADECRKSSETESTCHVDDCRWVATAYFSQNGEYTLTCETTDLAGNESSYGKTDVFVIDKTLPEIAVTYDNQKVRNNNYYNAPRTAFIEILEHNFDESGVNIMLRAENDGSIILAPKIRGWSKEGDIYRAQIEFDYDGEFFFDISYTDLAGNTTDSYSPDRFVVDLTTPEIIFFDIKDQSANNGKVAPGVRCVDKNLGQDGVTIELVGERNGILGAAPTKSVHENSVELKFEDFVHTPETDDIYRMQVAVTDLAGNRSEKNIWFSVNRFGSVYTFDEKTEALVGENGSYYTNQETELVILETNVDTLEFQKITLNSNGKLKTLAEGTDYQIFASENTEKWKQYTYRIAEKNFMEEGIYKLTIYSEDRAENISDNYSKGKKIEFAVDKTAPSVLIAGVENQKQYRENYRTVMIDVEDNLAVGGLEVTINGETIRYDAMEIAKAQGKIVLSVESSNDWQTMKIKAYDVAGNETQTEELQFLITANVFVQFYRNPISSYTLKIFPILFFIFLTYNKIKKKFRG